MRRAIRALVLALWLVGLVGATTAAADDLDARARAIGSALRCPVCQAQSVADSPSELAGQMRALIRQKVAAGESREAILGYFVDRYGEDVLLEPPARGFGLVVWSAPVLLLAGGALVVGRNLASRRAAL